MYGIVDLHDHILFFLSMILFIVLHFFILILKDFWYDAIDQKLIRHHAWDKNSESYFELPYYKIIRSRIFDGRDDLEYYKRSSFIYQWSTLKSGIWIEIIWTVIPSFILLLIAIPSFALLFAIDEIAVSKIMVKVIGHQWYWSYEVTGMSTKPFKIAFFDAYMLPDSDLVKGDLRLLKTDNALILPKNTPISVLITSDDVLHSWAIPACGVKVDAVPGRLSQISLLLKTSGIFHGQCSELCGVNHGFMPIELWVVDSYTFARLEWFLHEEISL